MYDSLGIVMIDLITNWNNFRSDYYEVSKQARTNNGPSRDKTEMKGANATNDQYPSKKCSIILLLRHGLESVDRSILNSRENPFQLSMHFLVMEFSPYFVVDKNGVNMQPNCEFTVLIL